jgi:hypothetical protein
MALFLFLFSFLFVRVVIDPTWSTAIVVERACTTSIEHPSRPERGAGRARPVEPLAWAEGRASDAAHSRSVTCCDPELACVHSNTRQVYSYSRFVLIILA